VQTAIYRPTNWLDPFDWSDIFADASRPLEIDIGCGKGDFLVWAAQAQPTHNFLGVERQLIRVRKVDKKVLRAGLTNVRMVRIEAGYFVSKLVPDHSVAVYHINFPDPWPKRRHARHRLFQHDFVEQLHRTLVGPVTTRGAASGDATHRTGAVNVATDDLDYFLQIRRVMAERFTEMPNESLPVEAQTEFERIFLAAGRPICRARFVC
jgi:tRNA (guanine-N7-)-methyltransferase